VRGRYDGGGTGFLRDHTKIRRYGLGRRYSVVVERSVYGPKSKATSVSLKGDRRILQMTLHRFNVSGTDS
jgi:hypothetical protein